MDLSLVERVLYKDGMMLVLDKPAGWCCTPTGPGIHLTDHLQELTFGKTRLPQVAHRLDRDTTGCLILGRHPAALRQLAELFQQRRLTKIYWALVRGNWPPSLVRLDQPLEGKEALTEVRVLGRGPEGSWLELRPLTGRKHQLRLHCARAGHPIVGDGTTSMRLHARRVEVPLYPKKPAVVVEAPLPSEWPAVENLGS